MFYSQRIHDKCYRRPHFDAGQFVESFDDENAQGLLPLQGRLQGPTTYNACSTVRWNDGTSWPVQSGHAWAAREEGFWDKACFADRLTNIHARG